MQQRLFRWAALALGAVAVGWAALAGVDRFVRGPSFEPARLRQAPAPLPPARESVRAFYSGHSLSDGVPDAMAEIARDLGVRFSFDVQSLVGSLVRTRLSPEHLEHVGLPRSGYDALIVTERHDLLYTLLHEDTLPSLRQMHERVSSASPALQTFVYHVWLEIDFAAPQHFVDYERAVLPVWQCTAGALERSIAARGLAGEVRVMPGGSALASLVERAVRAEVPGLSGSSSEERLSQIFADRVHLTLLGKYFMANVHFAALFGRSPEGAGVPSGVPSELGQALQRQAWEYVSGYLREHPRWPEAAACSDYVRHVACPMFAAHPREEEHPPSWLRRFRDTLSCSRAFADAEGPKNPFRSFPDSAEPSSSAK